MSAPTVLFLCTGNSARSIMAECLMNELGKGAMRALSAGSHPARAVHPDTIRVLKARGHDVTGLASKSWDVFAGKSASALDFIVTVCDGAKGEACPIWPGRPLSAHWGFPDPVGAGPDAFEICYKRIRTRIEHFLRPPVEGLGEEDWAARLMEEASGAAG